MILTGTCSFKTQEGWTGRSWFNAGCWCFSCHGDLHTELPYGLRAWDCLAISAYFYLIPHISGYFLLVSSMLPTRLPSSHLSSSRDLPVPTLGGQMTSLASQVFLHLGRIHSGLPGPPALAEPMIALKMVMPIFQIYVGPRPLEWSSARRD